MRNFPDTKVRFLWLHTKQILEYILITLIDAVGDMVEDNDSNGSLKSRRKALKGGTSIYKLAHYFHLPINAAAKKLGICPTVLKKICRKNGLPRWPHRKLQSIDRELKKLKDLVLMPGQKDSQINAIKQRIQHLSQERERICFRH